MSKVDFVNSRGVEWYLHSKVVQLRSGNRQHIYWFARSVDLETYDGQVPENMEIMETSRTGMPVLRKA